MVRLKRSTVEHARQGGRHVSALGHGGGQLLLQQVKQALDVGDGGFEVVRGSVDEVVEVDVGADELLVGGVQLLGPGPGPAARLLPPRAGPAPGR